MMKIKIDNCLKKTWKPVQYLKIHNILVIIYQVSMDRQNIFFVTKVTVTTFFMLVLFRKPRKKSKQIINLDKIQILAVRKQPVIY